MNLILGKKENMPKCTIDGKEVEFAPGENLITVAKRAGVEIPVFCYHPGLSVVAQCRMCYVEVEKMPKLQTACSTTATEGMVVKTNTENVKKGRAGTMEFLLLNHPLDCPICDKSGECDLQDNSFKYGNANMRHSEEKRTFVDTDMGPVIQKNMNRCIHCTRCIRFSDEIADIREMVAVKRANDIDITTIDGTPLQTDYAGNYADICPTGSLTLKDFRFKKRVWFLKKTPTLCEGCSRGCNMEIHHHQGTIYRCVPRENLAINKHWMCDEGRFNFHYTQDPSRILEPLHQTSEGLGGQNWEDALSQVNDFLIKPFSVLVGSDLTCEELQEIKKYFNQNYPKSNLYHFGTQGLTHSSEDGPADRLLKTKSKTSNLLGAEKLEIAPLVRMPDEPNIIVFRGGRAKLPDLTQKNVIGVGVFLETETSNYKIILPSLAFSEKDGTVISYGGVEQKFKASVKPKDSCKSVHEILNLLSTNFKRSIA